MDIVVCIKRVPDVAEADVSVAGDGRTIADDDLTWGLNEWDAFAVEEALRLREAHGGSVLALTVGGEEDEEVLRRALAMGADEALHVRADEPDVPALDPFTVATTLGAALKGRSFDLVLTGAMSGDGAHAQTGGMLAAILGIPQVALATRMEKTGDALEVQHEVEGGLERVVELDLPALVTVQTGINEPRYVSIRGIRKVAGVEIPVKELGDLDGAGGAARVVREELFLPPSGEGAEILEGDVDEVVAALVERMREKGGL